jgi:tetratricopeptide (TPR) repeat protein
VLASRALVLAMLTACGGGATQAPKVASAALPPANPAAVAKMVQGVQASKEPGGRPRAVGLLREAITIDVNLWEARYDLGVILASTGDLAGAEEQLAAAAKLSPDAEDIAVALGEVRRRRGESKAAADGLADFVQDHPQAVEARTLYVAALRESGQVDKAIEQAREALVRKQGDAGALAELALCHLAKGEKDTAELLAKQAEDANPKSAVAHRAMALVLLANGDDAASFVEFRKATDADPNDTTSRLNMGAVLLRAGVYAKAEEQFRAIVSVSPEDNEAALGLAAALRGEADAQHPQKLDEAKKLLEGILDRDSHDVAALYNLGVLLADFMKRPADAAPYFKRFLSDAPSDHPRRDDAQKYLDSANVGHGPPPPPAGPAPAPAPAPPGGVKK